MNNSNLTLRQFFVYQENVPYEWPSQLESGAAISNLREKIRSRSREAEWRPVFDEIKNNVGPLLDVGIADIMAAAWNKYRLLCKYLDREHYPAEKTVMLPLAEHTVKSEHRPAIEIYIHDHLIAKIDFRVTVSLSFAGLTLKIRNGRIMEILTGSCTGKGSIYCEDCLLVERTTSPFVLPGSINLGVGIPIA